MGIQINQAILDGPGDGDDPQSLPLPEGVYLVDDWAKMKEAKELPSGRTELFTVNDRVYTAPTAVDHRAVFRYMKAVRKGHGDEAAMADMMYETLGDAVMEALAEETLAPDEFRQVMRVVQKHVAGATKNALGN